MKVRTAGGINSEIKQARSPNFLFGIEAWSHHPICVPNIWSKREGPSVAYSAQAYCFEAYHHTAKSAWWFNVLTERFVSSRYSSCVRPSRDPRPLVRGEVMFPDVVVYVLAYP